MSRSVYQMAMTTREPLTFMETLEAELRKEIRKEIRAELLEEFGSETSSPSKLASPIPIDASVAAHERLELWLNSRLNLSPMKASANRRNGYGSKKTAPGAFPSQPHAEPVNPAPSAVNERLKHVFSVADIAALEFFRRYKMTLADDFTETDLKSAYRKIALLTHPDRHLGASEMDRKRFATTFADLANHVRTLSRHFQTAQSAA